MNFVQRIFNLMTWILLLAFVGWLAGFVIFAGTITSTPEPKIIEKTDAIIALTGGTKRLNHALDLFAEGKSGKLLITGVYKDVKLKELLKLWSYNTPLPDCCITLGYQADNTLGNALEARQWVEKNHVKTVRLVTATYHMPRALLEFRHALPNTKIIVHAVVPEDFYPDTKNFWKLSFLEYHKYLMSLFRVIFYPAETHPLPEALKK